MVYGLIMLYMAAILAFIITTFILGSGSLSITMIASSAPMNPIVCEKDWGGLDESFNFILMEKQRIILPG